MQLYRRASASAIFHGLTDWKSIPRNVYLRQDAFDAQVNTWLATAFAPARLSNTIDQIMAGQQVQRT